MLFPLHVLVSYYRPKPRRILLWHKADFEVIKNHILNFSTDFMNKFTTSTPINLLLNGFKTLCCEAVGSGEAGEALASPVFKLGVRRPKRLDYEIPFARSVCLFSVSWGIHPVL